MSKPFYDIGLYQGRVVSQGITQAKTGTPQFALRIKVLGPVESDGTFTPSKVQYERTIYMALTEGTKPFMVETLAILGFTGDKITQLDPSSPNHQTFVGNDYDFWCSHKQLQDGSGERERWQVSKGPQVMELKPLDPKAARQLDSLFGAALKGNKKATRSSTTLEPDGMATSASMRREVEDYAADPTEDEDDSDPLPF